MFGSQNYGTEHLRMPNAQSNLEQPSTNAAAASRRGSFSSCQATQSYPSTSDQVFVQGGHNGAWYNVENMTSSPPISQPTPQMITTQQHPPVATREDPRTQYQQGIPLQQIPMQQQGYYLDNSDRPNLYQGYPQNPDYRASVQASPQLAATIGGTQAPFVFGNTNYGSDYMVLNQTSQPMASGTVTPPSIVVTASDPFRYPPITTASVQQTYDRARFFAQNSSQTLSRAQYQPAIASSTSMQQPGPWETSGLSAGSTREMQAQSHESAPLAEQSRPTTSRRSTTRTSIMHNGVSIEVIPSTPRPRANASAAARGRPSPALRMMSPYPIPEERPVNMTATGRQGSNRRRTFAEFQDGYTAEPGPATARIALESPFTPFQATVSPAVADAEEPMTPPRRATPRPPVTIREDVPRYLEATTPEMAEFYIEEPVETLGANDWERYLMGNPPEPTTPRPGRDIPRVTTASEVMHLQDALLSDLYTWG